MHYYSAYQYISTVLLSRKKIIQQLSAYATETLILLKISVLICVTCSLKKIYSAAKMNVNFEEIHPCAFDVLGSQSQILHIRVQAILTHRYILIYSTFRSLKKRLL